MSGRRSYLAAAFSARPFGMPIPLNWFGVTAFALLGFFVNPGLWLIGAGLEGLYLWTLSRNPRFRAIVDAEAGRSNWDSRYSSLVALLDNQSRESQVAIERQAGEIVTLLARVGSTTSQIDDVRQMAWLHLRLLAARASVMQVIAAAARESESLREQERRIDVRLKRTTPTMNCGVASNNKSP